MASDEKRIGGLTLDQDYCGHPVGDGMMCVLKPPCPRHSPTHTDLMVLPESLDAADYIYKHGGDAPPQQIGGFAREYWTQYLATPLSDLPKDHDWNNEPSLRACAALIAAAFSPSGFQAGAEQKWQPIETAPKDGTNVLLAGRGWMTVGCYWPGRSCWTVDSVTGPQITQPIFGWTPLPSPPPEPLS